MAVTAGREEGQVIVNEPPTGSAKPQRTPHSTAMQPAAWWCEPPPPTPCMCTRTQRPSCNGRGRGGQRPSCKGRGRGGGGCTPVLAGGSCEKVLEDAGANEGAAAASARVTQVDESQATSCAAAASDSLSHAASSGGSSTGITMPGLTLQLGLNAKPFETRTEGTVDALPPPPLLLLLLLLLPLPPLRLLLPPPPPPPLLLILLLLPRAREAL